MTRIRLAVLALVGCASFEPGTCEPEPVPDCPEPGNQVVDRMALTWVGEDFTFDGQGHLVVAADWADLVMRTTREGDWSVVAPLHSDEIAGLATLSDGTLLVCDEANAVLLRLTPSGGWETVATMPSPNSIAVDANDRVYVTAFDRILRVDPDTGAREELERREGHDLDGLAFTEDGALWFNVDELGRVFRLSLVDGAQCSSGTFSRPLGKLELDGMAADACGNVYVLHTPGQISRILPDGTVEDPWLRLPNAKYTTSLHFGSGVGGWRADHLYVLDRDGQLFDIDVGIRGARPPSR